MIPSIYSLGNYGMWGGQPPMAFPGQQFGQMWGGQPPMANPGGFMGAFGRPQPHPFGGFQPVGGIGRMPMNMPFGNLSALGGGRPAPRPMPQRGMY